MLLPLDIPILCPILVGRSAQLATLNTVIAQSPGAARMVGAAGADGITSACAFNLARLKVVVERHLSQHASSESRAERVI